MRRTRGVTWIRSALVGVGVCACTVPAYVPEGDTDTDDTDVATDTDADTDVEDTDFWDTAGEAFGDTDDDDTEDTRDDTGDLAPLGCHPFDPVEGVGWFRAYAASFGSGPTGTERHEGVGWDLISEGIGASATEGWGYDITVTGAGTDNNSDGRVWMNCDLGAPGAYELAWRRTTVVFLVGNVTLRAGARQPRLYLPAEADILANRVGWNNVTRRYTLTQIGASGSGDLDLVHDDQAVVGFGMESVTVPAGTFANAYHINYIYETRQEAGAGGGGILGIFQGLFQALFAQLFGFTSEDPTVTAMSDRWYVRGIGLVKEHTVDQNTGAVIAHKELRGCGGLSHPSCP